MQSLGVSRLRTASPLWLRWRHRTGPVDGCLAVVYGTAVQVHLLSCPRHVRTIRMLACERKKQTFRNRYAELGAFVYAAEEESAEGCCSEHVKQVGSHVQPPHPFPPILLPLVPPLYIWHSRQHAGCISICLIEPVVAPKVPFF